MQYIHLTPLILGNKNIYLFIYNIILFIIYIFVILLIIISTKEESKIKYYKFYISIFRTFLPLICFTFFGHIFALFLSIFKCDLENKNSIIDDTLKCHNGLWFHLESFLTIICLIFLLYFTYITILIYYIPNFILEEYDTLKKSTSIPDIVLFLNKIAFIIIFNEIRTKENSNWFLIFVLFILTFANIWSVFHYNHFENKIIMKLNKFLSLILFWYIICLFIGKLFQIWNFNGTIHLFFSGAILIFFFIIFYSGRTDEFYNLDFKQIDSGEERLKYIKNFLNLIKMKDKCRNNYIIFNTLLLLNEENCINKNCKLKKYLELSEKGHQTDFILYSFQII